MKPNRVLFEEAGAAVVEAPPAGGGSASLFGDTPPSAAPANATPLPAAPPAAGAPPATTPPLAGNSDPWFKQLVSADGTLNKGAWANAPESLKKFQTSLEQYGSLEAALHALGHSKSLVGAKALARLPADAPQEAKDAQAKVLREVLNVPEKPDGYGITKPDKLPDGVVWDDKVVGEFASIAHKHNASPELVKDLLAFQMAKTAEQAAGIPKFQAEQRQREMNDLAASMPAGETVAKFMEKATQGMAVASKVSGIPVEQLKGMATTASMVKLLASFATIAGEDKLIAATQATNEGANIESQIKTLMNSKEYTHSDSAVRAPVLAEIRRLTELQYRLTQK